VAKVGICGFMVVSFLQLQIGCSGKTIALKMSVGLAPVLGN
jgi:hypothetical protein